MWADSFDDEGAENDDGCGAVFSVEHEVGWVEGRSPAPNRKKRGRKPRGKTAGLATSSDGTDGALKELEEAEAAWEAGLYLSLERAQILAEQALLLQQSTKAREAAGEKITRNERKAILAKLESFGAEFVLATEMGAEQAPINRSSFPASS